MLAHKSSHKGTGRSHFLPSPPGIRFLSCTKRHGPADSGNQPSWPAGALSQEARQSRVSTHLRRQVLPTDKMPESRRGGHRWATSDDPLHSLSQGGVPREGWRQLGPAQESLPWACLPSSTGVTSAWLSATCLGRRCTPQTMAKATKRRLLSSFLRVSYYTVTCIELVIGNPVGTSQTWVQCIPC